MVKNYVLEVGISNGTKKEILKYILQGLGETDKKYFVVTPNPEILVHATKHPSFRLVLNEAKLALADGVGIMLAGKLLGKPFQERLTGVDIMESLCSEVAEEPATVGFLGARGKIAELTSECLQKKYPGLKVVFAENGNPDEETAKSIREHLKTGVAVKQATHTNDIDGSLPIQNSAVDQLQAPKKVYHHIDILFVAFGFPKQEEWMHSYLASLPVSVAIGVGGAFDYISKKVPRAPKFLRDMGFEWLFRLLTQPWRIRRQVALLEFLYLILKERFSQKYV